MRLRVLLAIAVLICAFIGYEAYQRFGPSIYRYRIVVTVNTPEGVKTGAAVREVQYSRAIIKLPESAAAVATQEGEAVIIDLPDGRPLFALLSTDPYDVFQAAYGNDRPETLNAALAAGRVVPLKPIPGRIPAQSGYPRFVRFRDLDDPSSIEDVDPKSIQSTGGKYAVRTVTIQMTSAAVTHQISNRLAWIGKFEGGYIPNTNGLCECSFKMGN